MKNLLLSSFVVLLLSCTVQQNPIKQTSKAENSAVKNTEVKDYFTAAGNEPFWRIAISKNQIVFKSVDSSLNLTCPHVNPIDIEKPKTKMYQSKTEEGELIVELTPGNCSDTMSGIQHNYIVTVKIKIKNAKAYTSFKGCGNYSSDFRP